MPTILKIYRAFALSDTTLDRYKCGIRAEVKRKTSPVMDDLRTEIWDHLNRTGPQTVEQIAGRLRIDTVAVVASIEHEWFEIQELQFESPWQCFPAPVRGSLGEPGQEDS